MKQKLQLKPIKRIICPHCRKTELVLRNSSKDFNIGSFPKDKEREWHCPNCPSFFPENWFNVFRQFENLVEREK